MKFKGQYVNGRFAQGGEASFKSKNPATDDDTVFEAQNASQSQIDDAIASARADAVKWRRLPFEERANIMMRVADRVDGYSESIARAISLEMGKAHREALVEARSIKSKIIGSIQQIPHELPSAPPGAPGEQRFHAMGVVGVIGPFNFPIHLLNTHLIPALLTGNTAVIKPSDVTPLCGQLYAELFHDSDIPAGVFNLIQGDGRVGASLSAHEGIDGLVFTGSYETGRRIRQATFDQPWKKVSLELGGKNVALVLDDAHLEQAIREIILGAFLTTGQRCTATSRVVVTRGLSQPLLAGLKSALTKLKVGNPMLSDVFMGPLATKHSQSQFTTYIDRLKDEGGQLVSEGAAITDNGAFVAPSLFRVVGDEAVLKHEFFGPNICVEVAEDEDDGFRRAAANEFGLSASLFSRRAEMLERFYDEVRVGVVNFNRSTNGASGLLPFGGTGKSGNWRPAGSLGPRLATYPVAVMQQAHGLITSHPCLDE